MAVSFVKKLMLPRSAYSFWQRIEDKRIISTLEGFNIGTASKFRIELREYPATPMQRLVAARQLLNATIEYGDIAPSEADERWINCDTEEVQDLQTLRVGLYNLFFDMDLLGLENKQQRKDLWAAIQRIVADDKTGNTSFIDVIEDMQDAIDGDEEDEADDEEAPADDPPPFCAAPSKPKEGLSWKQQHSIRETD